MLNTQVGITVGVGCAAVVAQALLDAHFPAPGSTASIVQGVFLGAEAVPALYHAAMH